MLPSLSAPTLDDLRDAVRAEVEGPLTYEAVGGTWAEPPEAPAFDEQEVVLGQGRAAFERASHLLRTWTQFDLPWIRTLDRETPLEEGAMFAFASHQLGVWSVNVCRIVRVVDEADGEGARLGFSYGTVGTHALRGEERFLVTWDARSDKVRFGIRKFSTPANLLTQLLGPVARGVQRRFTQDALARLAGAMQP
jgi:uncharacterized protein (UPF0548 family)